MYEIVHFRNHTLTGQPLVFLQTPNWTYINAKVSSLLCHQAPCHLCFFSCFSLCSALTLAFFVRFGILSLSSPFGSFYDLAPKAFHCRPARSNAHTGSEKPSLVSHKTCIFVQECCDRERPYDGSTCSSQTNLHSTQHFCVLESTLTVEFNYIFTKLQ